MTSTPGMTVTPGSANMRTLLGLDPGEEIGGRDAQSGSEGDELRGRGVPFRSLDTANVVDVRVGRLGEHLLGHAASEPELPHVLPEPT